MLSLEEYSRVIVQSGLGEPCEHLLEETNNTTRQLFKEWKQKQDLSPDQSIQLFKINGGDDNINPSEEEITNQYGNIYNFGFTFAMVCTEQQRRDMIETIKDFHHTPFQQASEAYTKIELLQADCKCFITFWI